MMIMHYSSFIELFYTDYKACDGQIILSSLDNKSNSGVMWVCVRKHVSNDLIRQECEQ